MQMTNQALGALGEDIAADFLRQSGFVILDRNWRAHRVELDIVARDGRTLVFCEVKTRRSISHGLPVEAITALKREHLRTAASAWLGSHKLRTNGIRFDAIGIVYSTDGLHTISHIRGVEV